MESPALSQSPHPFGDGYSLITVLHSRSVSLVHRYNTPPVCRIAPHSARHESPVFRGCVLTRYSPQRLWRYREPADTVLGHRPSLLGPPRYQTPGPKTPWQNDTQNLPAPPADQNRTIPSGSRWLLLPRPRGSSPALGLG